MARKIVLMAGWFMICSRQMGLSETAAAPASHKILASRSKPATAVAVSSHAAQTSATLAN
jgi:hypothetical protein